MLTVRLLIPQIVKVQSRGKVHFTDAFCGAYMTIAVSKEGHVYGFGLSNYHQLGECLDKSLFDNLQKYCNRTWFILQINLPI